MLMPMSKPLPKLVSMPLLTLNGDVEDAVVDMEAAAEEDTVATVAEDVEDVTEDMVDMAADTEASSGDHYLLLSEIKYSL